MVFKNLIRACDQGFFFTARQFFNFRLAPTGAAAAVPIFAVNHADRFASVKILRTLAALQVLRESAIDISRYSSVERCVAGFDDIKRPGRVGCWHVLFRIIAAQSLSDRGTLAALLQPSDKSYPRSIALTAGSRTNHFATEISSATNRAAWEANFVNRV